MHFVLGNTILQGPEPEVEHKQSLTKRANLQIESIVRGETICLKE